MEGYYLAWTMGSDFIIRPLESLEEYRTSQQIMAATWGSSVDDVEPTHMLIAAREAGGLVAGAFEADRLVGFSFAFPGRVSGRNLLYSHMTAVLPEWQEKGVGTRIKWYQRAWALEHDFDLVRWTFDPLMAANARFNLHRLGACAVDYHIDFYGHSSSALHGVLPTDRFVADWELNDPRVCVLAEGGVEEVFGGDPGEIPLLYGLEEGRPALQADWRVPAPADAPFLAAPIPDRVLELQQADRDRAEAWRLGSRMAFIAALESGYRFVDFIPRSGTGEPSAREAYLLAASSGPVGGDREGA